MTYLNERMKQLNMTRADICRKSGIPDSTLRDILNGKAQIDRCEAGTLLGIADALNIMVEDIVTNYWEECFDDQNSVQPKLHDSSSLIDFYNMVENTMIKLKSCRDMGFVKSICSYHWIELFYAAGFYRAAFFLLGLIDHLCVKHHQKLEPRYVAYRSECLDQPVYSLRTLEEGDSAHEYLDARIYTENHAVIELARFNIYMTENDITPKP